MSIKFKALDFGDLPGSTWCTHTGGGKCISSQYLLWTCCNRWRAIDNKGIKVNPKLRKTEIMIKIFCLKYPLPGGWRMKKRKSFQMTDLRWLTKVPYKMTDWLCKMTDPNLKMTDGLTSLNPFLTTLNLLCSIQ